MKRVLSLLFIFTLLTITACDPTDINTGPIGVMISSDGEPVATNFYDYDFEYSYLPDENTASDNISIQAAPSMVTGIREVRVGAQPNNSLEAECKLPAGYLLTGVGIRAASKTVTTLVCEGRFLNSNGTMGQRKRFRSGSEPNHDLEVWWAAPDNHAITGFGTRMYEKSIYTMRVDYRRISRVNNKLRLTENVKTAKVGKEPNHSLEVYYSPPPNHNPDRSVFCGLGLRAKDKSIFTMMALIGYFPL